MPRSPRFCPAGYPVHVIQRGNNRQAIFTCDADCAAYAGWLAEGINRFDVSIHGWVFMTNHVHLLATPVSEGSISELMQFVGRLYVRRFNRKYTRSGTLFEGRFRSNIVQEDRYLLACLRYIELNPVRAGMVGNPGDYYWSSYACHAFGVHAQVWTPHPLYLNMGSSTEQRQQAWRELAHSGLDVETLTEVRHCANTGLALGTEAFRDQIKRLRA